MNLHIHANHHLGAQGIAAYPVERIGPFGERVLDEVVIESNHPAGRGLVRMTPGQTLTLLARLTQIDASLFHAAPPIEFVIREVSGGTDGETAWPIVHTDARGNVECDEVVVGDGSGLGVVHLSPHQVRELMHELTSVALTYLHENAWGGEDAWVQ